VALRDRVVCSREDDGLTRRSVEGGHLVSGVVHRVSGMWVALVTIHPALHARL
jgi:hypothetical protein